ncbi:hypothetical protein F8388_006084 [Cannabis sativa]|uniref:Uncharacterized protein n=1 Tax=Cannabis sativa TaxID=3483 RepID=A0A7J6H5N9_CANSA|nr:hypothetical protein F8388_006084 [Cannabis sativa]KAF4404658.1 hypothetical protein G4B88_006044 [Cannabis sativa]
MNVGSGLPLFQEEGSILMEKRSASTEGVLKTVSSFPGILDWAFDKILKNREIKKCRPQAMYSSRNYRIPKGVYLYVVVLTDMDGDFDREVPDASSLVPVTVAEEYYGQDVDDHDAIG